MDVDVVVVFLSMLNKSQRPGLMWSHSRKWKLKDDMQFFWLLK